MIFQIRFNDSYGHWHDAKLIECLLLLCGRGDRFRREEVKFDLICGVVLSGLNCLIRRKF